jgi:succinate-semialdehyde dehydrogenase/glutarate-semialdehyde dehydrogenase
LTAAVRGLKVGHGTKAGVTLGPLINEAALQKVEAHIADEMDAAREETFGPLAPLFRFSSDEEVVKLAPGRRAAAGGDSTRVWNRTRSAN